MQALLSFIQGHYCSCFLECCRLLNLQQSYLVLVGGGVSGSVSLVLVDSKLDLNLNQKIPQTSKTFPSSRCCRDKLEDESQISSYNKFKVPSEYIIFTSCNG